MTTGSRNGVRTAMHVVAWWAVALGAVLVGLLIVYMSAWAHYTDGKSTGWEILLLPLFVLAVAACVLSGRSVKRHSGSTALGVVVACVPLVPVLAVTLALA